MNSSQRELLSHLITRSQVLIKDVAKALNLSSNNTQMHLEVINGLLGKDKLIIRNHTIYITNEARAKGYKLLASQAGIYPFYTSELRASLVIIKILTDANYHTLQSLADFVYVSKNTMINDIKLVRRNLPSDELHIEYSRTSGYKITGSEYLLRNLLVSEIRKVISVPLGKCTLVEKKLVQPAEVFILKQRLEKVERTLEISLSDERIEELPYILLMIICRAKVFPDKWSFKIAPYESLGFSEYPQIKQMFWGYEALTETDILYLSLQIISSNIVETSLQISDSDSICAAVEEFLSLIEFYLASTFRKRSVYKGKLMLHIRPAIYRSLLGIEIPNPLTEQFIEQYNSTYQYVAKAAVSFEQLVGHPFSREELVYISMLVQAWIYEREETNTKVFKAIIVSQGGTSITKLLLETLKQLLPSFAFVGEFQVRHLPDSLDHIDFIFTTSPLTIEAVPTIMIPSIFDFAERKRLVTEVDTLIHNDSRKQAMALVAQLKEDIPLDRLDTVKRKVETFFTEQKRGQLIEVKPIEKSHYPFTTSNISIVRKQIEWSFLIDCVFEPMRTRGSVPASYIAECKRNFYQHYRQMIIGPNIYLPHARMHQEQVMEDYQVCIFKRYIASPEGTPINIVVALAPSTSNHHIPTLLMLNELFLDKNAICQLTSATSKEAVLAILEGARDGARIVTTEQNKVQCDFARVDKHDLVKLPIKEVK